MKIEDQCCTLEQAERLNNLGVKYSSPQYVYILRLDEFKLSNVDEYNRWAAQYNALFVHETKHFPAFTVAELGVLLPDYYESHRGLLKETWYCDDVNKPDQHNDWFAMEKTEAQARAAMLIYLLENKLITPEEVNQRLCNNYH